MFEFIQNLWSVITIPLSWMPSFCQRLLMGLVLAVALTVILPLCAKLVTIGIDALKALF